MFPEQGLSCRSRSITEELYMKTQYALFAIQKSAPSRFVSVLLGLKLERPPVAGVVVELRLNGWMSEPFWAFALAST
jgi:hypothetical protein